MVRSQRNDRPARVCFVSPNAYDAVSNRPVTQHIGGAEVQLVALSRGLARHDVSVSFVTWDHGQPDAENCDGIIVYKMCGPQAGLVGLRFVHPRWSSMWAAMRRADADIYCQVLADGDTGQVAAWCKHHDRPFVFIVMSDADCRRARAGMPWRHALLRWYGLRASDLIVAQTEAQRALLQRWLRRDSVVIRPCLAGLRGHGAVAVSHRTQRALRVLWVGRFGRVKRLEWLLDLAEQLPGLTFDVVGQPNHQDEYARALQSRASEIPNVILHGYVARDEISRFYAAACLLVLTSKWEGFPTIFMEAWSHGTPTVSTVDPDGLLTRHGLGAVASDRDGLRAAMCRLIRSEDEWRACSVRAQQYVRNHHSEDAAAEAFGALIERERSATTRAASAES